jgi:hypothetical protein
MGARLYSSGFRQLGGDQASAVELDYRCNVDSMLIDRR